MQRTGGGGYPQPPLKRLPANFCQPRNDPLPHLAEKVKGGRGGGSQWSKMGEAEMTYFGTWPKFLSNF